MMILAQKIADPHYRQLIEQYAAQFSPAERDLLAEIVQRFEFDAIQTQALVQAVLQQSRFDPNANHLADDEEEGVGICPHCLNPPVPPLRDYAMWREQNLS
ncbi:hypothetical protein SAMN02746062_01831 [Alysiella filiformis DSM 16848]|uniref:Uncharacterized protein n=2 Tax=Alysiella TaxID=194195 RepID=A0A286EG36_9NEIS|nr:hypothetical protein SAMN02746062_01831 [Alysiella filiformis DSM 16848]